MAEPSDLHPSDFLIDAARDGDEIAIDLLVPPGPWRDVVAAYEEALVATDSDDEVRRVARLAVLHFIALAIDRGAVISLAPDAEETTP